MTKPYLLVPVWDGYPQAKEDLHNLLKSLELGAYQEYFRVLVQLDGCHRIFEHEFKSQYKDFEFHNHTGNPRNYTGNSNLGLRRARVENVGSLLVNMDCVMPSFEAFSPLISFSETSLVSAQTSQTTGDLTERVLELTRRSKNPNFTNVMDIPGNKFAGFCYWIPPQILQKIGVLDESFVASMDDDDYVVRSLLAGFEAYVSSVNVEHVGSHIDQVSFGGSRSGAYSMDSLGLHYQKYKIKYSIPPNIAHSDCIKWVLDNFTWQEEMLVV